MNGNCLTSGLILAQKWLRKQVQGKGYFWMGLTDKEEENVWRWLDGTQPTFSSVLNVLNTTVICCLQSIKG